MDLMSQPEGPGMPSGTPMARVVGQIVGCLPQREKKRFFRFGSNATINTALDQKSRFTFKSNQR
jgi:hypothetical protein